MQVEGFLAFSFGTKKMFSYEIDRYFGFYDQWEWLAYLIFFYIYYLLSLAEFLSNGEMWIAFW